MGEFDPRWPVCLDHAYLELHLMADSDFDDDLWNDAGDGVAPPRREDSVDSFDWPDDEDAANQPINLAAGKSSILTRSHRLDSSSSCSTSPAESSMCITDITSYT